MMACKTSHGGRSPRRPPAAFGARLWPEIGYGLIAAAAGILLILCVARAETALPRIIPPAPAFTLGIQHAPGAAGGDPLRTIPSPVGASMVPGPSSFGLAY
ncbi:MAG TPA: hypothetical protein VGG99_12490 [Acetobacteraceae bacterium]|jgi:hypothetical protein